MSESVPIPDTLELPARRVRAGVPVSQYGPVRRGHCLVHQHEPSGKPEAAHTQRDTVDKPVDHDTNNRKKVSEQCMSILAKPS